MSDSQTPVESVPPASRLGEIVGWSLLALGVACLIASLVAIVQADAASQAVQHAEHAWHNAIVTEHNAIVVHPDHTMAYATPYEAAYMAAKVAYNEAELRILVLESATVVFLSIIPGLLYAMKPSLLGGLWGRLLRPSSAKLAECQPRRRHPITFYRGIGIVLMGIGYGLPYLLPTVGQLRGVFNWLSFNLMVLAILLFPICLLFAFPLMGEARWWYTSSRVANRELERPQA